MRNKIVLRLNDLEMNQLRTLAQAFNSNESTAVKECVNHAFKVYVQTLKEAAAKHMQKAKESTSDAHQSQD